MKFCVGEEGKSRIDKVWNNLKECLHYNSLCKFKEDREEYPCFSALSKGQLECVEIIFSLKRLFDCLRLYHSDAAHARAASDMMMRTSWFSKLNLLSPAIVFDPTLCMKLGSGVSKKQSTVASYNIPDQTDLCDPSELNYYVRFPRPNCVWRLPKDIDQFWQRLLPFVPLNNDETRLNQLFETKFWQKAPVWRYRSLYIHQWTEYLQKAEFSQSKAKLHGAISLYMWRLYVARTGIYIDPGSYQVDEAKLKQYFGQDDPDDDLVVSSAGSSDDDEADAERHFQTGQRAMGVASAAAAAAEAASGPMGPLGPPASPSMPAASGPPAPIASSPHPPPPPSSAEAENINQQDASRPATPIETVAETNVQTEPETAAMAEAAAEPDAKADSPPEPVVETEADGQADAASETGGGGGGGGDDGKAEAAAAAVDSTETQPEPDAPAESEMVAAAAAAADPQDDDEKYPRPPLSQPPEAPAEPERVLKRKRLTESERLKLRKELRIANRERRKFGRNRKRRDLLAIDTCGTPDSKLHEDDFMTNHAYIDPKFHAQRTARRARFRELWIAHELENSNVSVMPPPPYTYTFLQEENGRDSRMSKELITKTLESFKGDRKHPDFVEFEEYEKLRLRDVKFGRLSRILIDDVGFVSAGASAMIKYLHSMLNKNNPHKSLNRLRTSPTFRDTTAFQEMLITIATIPKAHNGTFKNFHLMLLHMIQLYPQYLAKEMPLNVRVTGHNSAGKSWALRTVFEIAVPGSVDIVAHISNMAHFTSVSDISDKAIFIEEAPVSIFLALGQAGDDATKVTLWKNRLTAITQKYTVLGYDRDGNRVTIEGDVIAGNAYGMAMNAISRNMHYDEAMLSRFFNICIDSMQNDTARAPPPPKSGHQSTADDQLKEQNKTRFRNHQTLTYAVCKAIKTKTIDPVTMHYAHILVQKVLDEAASRGATETRHARKLERISMAIESLCIQRAVYQFYFMQQRATEYVYPENEEWKPIHLARIEPMLVPFQEEIVFCLLMFDREFEDRSVDLIGNIIKNQHFSTHQEGRIEGFRLRCKITDEATKDMLTNWYNSDQIARELHRTAPWDFESTYGVSVGYHSHKKNVPEAKEIEWHAVDPHRFAVEIYDQERFIKDVIAQAQASLHKSDINASVAMDSLLSPTSIARRPPIPATFKVTDHLEPDPRMLSFLTVTRQNDKNNSASRMVVVSDTLLRDKKHTARPVFDAINEIMSRSDRVGDMWLMPQMLDDGSSQWLYFRTPINPRAKPLKFDAIDRLSKVERSIQVRMHTKLNFSQLDHSYYERNRAVLIAADEKGLKHRVTEAERLAIEQAAAQKNQDVWDSRRRAFEMATEQRAVAANAMATIPGLDLSEQKLDFDEFCLAQRMCATGPRRELLEQPAHLYLKSVTPATWRANRQQDLGAMYSGFASYEDLKQLNYWNFSRASHAVDHEINLAVDRKITEVDEKKVYAGGSSRMVRGRGGGGGSNKRGGRGGRGGGAMSRSLSLGSDKHGMHPNDALSSARAASQFASGSAAPTGIRRPAAAAAAAAVFEPSDEDRQREMMDELALQEQG
jgi:hypothetical protein